VHSQTDSTTDSKIVRFGSFFDVLTHVTMYSEFLFDTLNGWDGEIVAVGAKVNELFEAFPLGVRPLEVVKHILRLLMLQQPVLN
jgi:hypothetical protein